MTTSTCAVDGCARYPRFGDNWMRPGRPGTPREKHYVCREHDEATEDMVTHVTIGGQKYVRQSNHRLLRLLKERGK